MRCSLRQFCSLKQSLISGVGVFFFISPPPNRDGKCYNQNQVTRDQCTKEQLLHAVMHNISVLENDSFSRCNIYGNVLQERC